MSVIGKHVAILVDNYFEEIEFKSPLLSLKKTGALVTIVGIRNNDVRGMNHAKFGNLFQVDTLLKEVDTAQYDALVIPGGVINVDTLRMEQGARQWVNNFIDTNKLIAAICHAPWLLVSADVVEERRLTSYFTLQDDIRNAGGEWTDRSVVVDQNLITSRTPDDLRQFNHAIKQWFQ